MLFSLACLFVRTPGVVPANRMCFLFIERYSFTAMKFMDLDSLTMKQPSVFLKDRPRCHYQAFSNIHCGFY